MFSVHEMHIGGGRRWWVRETYNVLYEYVHMSILAKHFMCTGNTIFVTHAS